MSVAQVARDLDVHENVLRKWVKEFAADPAAWFPVKGQMKPEQLEIERLRREVIKLKAERDILKKAAAYFAKDSMKFASVAKHRGIWPAGWLCEALGVSRGGFYAWLTRPRSARSRSDEAMAAKVRSSFIASDRSYSVAPSLSPRITPSNSKLAQVRGTNYSSRCPVVICRCSNSEPRSSAIGRRIASAHRIQFQNGSRAGLGMSLRRRRSSTKRAFRQIRHPDEPRVPSGSRK